MGMKARQILVVGGAGYIGAHMVNALLRANYEVVTLDNLSTGHRDLVPGGALVVGNLGDNGLSN
jgi:UDP-glucose 4-epimerase